MAKNDNSSKPVPLRMGLRGIRFAGFRNQSELPAFFAMADVFVLPSQHEPSGTDRERSDGLWLCRGLLSDDVGSHADLVANGVEGFVYPTGDVDALAAALQRVLSSPEQAHRMGEAAMSRIANWDFEADVRGLRLGSLPSPIAAGLNPKVQRAMPSCCGAA